MTHEELSTVIKETIGCLEYLLEDDCTDTQYDYIEEIQIAIEALKKQNPMKIKDIHVDEYYCPACGAENNCDQKIIYDEYCPCCGQRLYVHNDFVEDW